MYYKNIKQLTDGKRPKCSINDLFLVLNVFSGTVLMKLSPSKPIDFHADHPFLYFIMVNDQQLFSGTFVDPETKSH